jgi:S1-C subfamily serine protease
LGRFIASGTGFFVSASGHLLTCEHVIHGADRVRIVYDGKRIPVTIVATDKKLDCAVLQAAVQSPHLRLGDSAAVKLASPVFTIGFPNADIQGLSPKYTRGEISSLTGVEDDQRCFQVSVPVQSGNSGGPLADGSGCVVGMVNAQLNAKALQEAGRSLPQNVNYAIKSAILAGVLARAGVMAPVTPSPRAGSRDAVVETVKGATVLVMSYTD